MRYRSWAERREIIKSVIVADATGHDAATPANPHLIGYELTDAELRFFRARSNRAIAKLAKDTSTFKEYYKLQTSKPFMLFGMAAVFIVLLCIGGFIYLSFWYPHDNPGPYTLMAAAATVAVAAIGWGVAGWVAYKNATIQHTINVLAARFSQNTFSENVRRFHSKFGYDLYPLVRMDVAKRLRDSSEEEDQRLYQSIVYLLNYFEFLATGVIDGNLDERIVRKTLRSTISYYFDKCEPMITAGNKENPSRMEHFIKLRMAYREP